MDTTMLISAAVVATFVVVQGVYLGPQLSFLNNVPNCTDNPGYGSLCAWWASSGECEWNWHFMLRECRFSCGICAALSRVPPPCGYGPKNGTLNPGSGLLVHFPNFPIYPFPSYSAHQHVAKGNPFGPYAVPKHLANQIPGSGKHPDNVKHVNMVGQVPLSQAKNIPGVKLLKKVGQMHGIDKYAEVGPPAAPQGGSVPGVKHVPSTGGYPKPAGGYFARKKRQVREGKCQEEVDNRVLFGGNRAMIEGLTKEQCAIECFYETGFDCKAAVYYKDTRDCLLYDFNGNEFPDRVLAPNPDEKAVLVNVETKPVPECPPIPPRQQLVRCVTLEQPNTILFGGNIAMREGLSYEQCKEACISDASYNCLAGVYYEARQTCLTYDFNDLTRPERIQPTVPEEGAKYFRTEQGADICPSDLCSGDQDPLCHFWASTGQCTINPLWMLPNCPVSCMITDITPKGPS